MSALRNLALLAMNVSARHRRIRQRLRVLALDARTGGTVHRAWHRRTPAPRR